MSGLGETGQGDPGTAGACGGDGAGQAAGVECDGERVAVWVAGDGAGSGGLVAAVRGRLDVAGE
jgi:hypothetical protein